LGGGKKFASTKIWDDIIKEVDVNGDGEISYDEFKLMMTKFLKPEAEKSFIELQWYILIFYTKFKGCCILFYFKTNNG